MRGTASRFGGAVDRRPSAASRSSAAKRQVVAHRHRQHQAVGLAVLRHQRDADVGALGARAGSAIATGWPSTAPRRSRRAARRTAPAGARAGPGRRARRGRRSRRRAAASSMSCSRSVHDEAAHLEARRRLARGACAGLGGKTLLDVAADHHLDDLVVGLRCRPRRSRRCGRCGTPSSRRPARRSRACGARCRRSPGPRRAGA